MKRHAPNLGGIDFTALYRKWAGKLVKNRPKEKPLIESEVETGRAVSRLPEIPTDSGFTNYGRKGNKCKMTKTTR